MRKRVLWKRENIDKLKELINQKSNVELIEIFNCKMSELVSVMQRYKIKRDEEFLKQLRNRMGEFAPNWLGGNRKPDIKKHKAVQKLRYPERFKAREAVANAVKAGKFIKPDVCEDCGEKPERKRDMHFHHTADYEKENWFVGKWVCRKCHRKIHSGTH